jgi:dTDP-4-amino-4,6-dideoxygalactose transaminase
MGKKNTMQVPLLDLQAQLATIGDEVRRAVLEVVDSTRYILGPKVEQLEARIAEVADTRFGIGVSSGTDALLVSLMALGVGPGDLVLTSPYSFFATAGVIARLNATPAFVDIDPESYNLDPRALRRWFAGEADKAARVKAIIPVHLYGQCAEMDPILELAGQRGIPVVEDAAQAIGARYAGRDGMRRAGSMGALGCFSFFPSKNLGGIGDGGMVTTSDEGLAQRLYKLRNHGAQPKYYHSLVGGNFRLDPLQAAVLLVKLPHLEAWSAKRRRNAAYYDARLNVAGVQKPRAVQGLETHVYNQYVIAVAERRDELRAFLSQNQIGSEIYYPLPFHEQECFRHLGYRRGDFPVSEYAARHTLALPIYPELTPAMQDYVIEKIGEFYG